jgi:hypothetical protein
MASLRATTAGLELVDKARIRKGWHRQAAIWHIQANVGLSTLKRFWKSDRPKVMGGYGISYDAFVSIVSAVGEDWRKVAGFDDETQLSEATRREAIETSTLPETPVLILHEMPEPREIYGRSEKELPQLINLVAQSRLVFLWGMGGIGKTALAAQMVDQLAYGACAQPVAFDRIIWRGLSAGSNLDHFWTQLDLDLGITPQLNLHTTRYDWTDPSRLVAKFQAERTLVVIDVVESNPVERAEDIPAWEPADRARYCEWFAQLSRPRHNSCILVLSREHYNEVQQLEGTHPAVRSLKLEGLKLGGIQLLEQYNLKPETDAWRALIDLYRGNPYALTMIATLIKDQFGGSARELLTTGTLVLGKMECVIAERIRHITPEEKTILTLLARLKEPCDRATLWAELQNQTLEPSSAKISQSTLIESIASLDRKCLIEIMTEQENVLFTLQPMVMKYVRRNWA